METERFPFYMSFWAWQGGFNSRLGPVYFGMGRISLCAELLSQVCAPTPFIRWRYRLAPGDCALGMCSRPVHILFYTPSVAPITLG